MRLRQNQIAYMSRADPRVLPHPCTYSARGKSCSLYSPSIDLSQIGRPVGHPTLVLSKGGTILK